MSLPEGVDPDALDRQADALTEGMDDAERRRALSVAAQMTNIYGAPDRIRALAADLVTHWEKRRELIRPQIGGPARQ